MQGIACIFVSALLTLATPTPLLQTLSREGMRMVLDAAIRSLSSPMAVADGEDTLYRHLRDLLQHELREHGGTGRGLTQDRPMP